MSSKKDPKKKTTVVKKTNKQVQHEDQFAECLNKQKIEDLLKQNSLLKEELEKSNKIIERNSQRYLKEMDKKTNAIDTLTRTLQSIQALTEEF